MRTEQPNDKSLNPQIFTVFSFIGLMVILFTINGAFLNNNPALEYDKPIFVSSQPPLTSSYTVSLNQTNIKNFTDDFIAGQLNNYSIPGASIAIVNSTGVLYQNGYGFANLDDQTPVKANETIFPMASVSKLFTWTAAMQLYEQGILNLTEDSRHYIENTSIRFGSQYDDPITMHHLMSHTAGFEESIIGDAAANINSTLTYEEYLSNHVPLQLYRPGEIVAYSNYGTTLAGFIIELLTNQSFCEYIFHNILEPLAMEQSFFTHYPTNENNLAFGYTEARDELIQSLPPILNIVPAGGLYSTAADMAKFMMAHLNNGTYQTQSILQPNTTELMHTQHYTLHKLLPGWAHGFYELKYQNYTVISHGGDISGYSTALYLLKEQDIGIFVAYNKAGQNQARRELLNEFLYNFFDLTQSREITSNSLDISLLQGYTGDYRTTRRVESHLFKINNLFSDDIRITANEEGFLYLNKEIKLIHVQDHIFQAIETGTYVVFLKNEEGDIEFFAIENEPTNAYQKLSFWENITFHRVAAIIFTIIIASGCIISIISISVRIIRSLKSKSTENTNSSKEESKNEKPEKHLQQSTQSDLDENSDQTDLTTKEKVLEYLSDYTYADLIIWLSWIISWILIGFLIAFSLHFDFSTWYLSGGAQLSIKLLLTMPLLARIFALFNLILLLNALLDKYWKLYKRIYYVMLEIAIGGLLLWMYYWNLLGYSI